MDPDELDKLRPGRKQQEAKDRAAIKAKQRRSQQLTKTEKERLRTGRIAKAALIESFATEDVRDDDGRVNTPKFCQLLRDRRDRVSEVLAHKCRMNLLKETAYENGTRNWLWLTAHGHNPEVPLPPGPIVKNSFYKRMVEIDLARVLAIFQCRPETFNKKEREDINFYFFMLKEQAIVPDPVVVRYFTYRWQENHRTRIWAAGQRTKSE
jgi:hypothetical protein